VRRAPALDGQSNVSDRRPEKTSEALLARGEYLTKAADCVACHTAPGGRPFAGGRAFQLPFGTIYAPNITPIEKLGSVRGAMQNLSVRCAVVSVSMARTCIRLSPIRHTA
jgi:hypothetical protein